MFVSIAMEDDIQEEVRSQFKDRRLSGWQILQLAAGSGLGLYAVWAGVLMPGFRRVPLRLQVSFEECYGINAAHYE